MSRLLDDAVGELSRLPGIGRRTALRLAIHMLRMEKEEVVGMTGALNDFRLKVRNCSVCNNLSDEDICTVCSDPSRDRTTVCVVENVSDVISIENTRQYRGVYHVLGGVISPMQGIGPSDLKIDMLLDNIAKQNVREVILAVSTTVEGETTQFYITRRLAEIEGLKITSIARGLGFSDSVEYADELTLTHALINRTDIR